MNSAAKSILVYSAIYPKIVTSVLLEKCVLLEFANSEH